MDINEVFNQVDTDSDGVITRTEFEVFSEQTGLQLNKDVVLQMLEAQQAQAEGSSPASVDECLEALAGVGGLQAGDTQPSGGADDVRQEEEDQAAVPPPRAPDVAADAARAPATAAAAAAPAAAVVGNAANASPHARNKLDSRQQDAREPIPKRESGGGSHAPDQPQAVTNDGGEDKGSGGKAASLPEGTADEQAESLETSPAVKAVALPAAPPAGLDVADVRAPLADASCITSAGRVAGVPMQNVPSHGNPPFVVSAVQEEEQAMEQPMESGVSPPDQAPSMEVAKDKVEASGLLAKLQEVEQSDQAQQQTVESEGSPLDAKPSTEVSRGHAEASDLPAKLQKAEQSDQVLATQGSGILDDPSEEESEKSSCRPSETSGITSHSYLPEDHHARPLGGMSYAMSDEDSAESSSVRALATSAEAYAHGHRHAGLSYALSDEDGTSERTSVTYGQSEEASVTAQSGPCYACSDEASDIGEDAPMWTSKAAYRCLPLSGAGEPTEELYLLRDEHGQWRVQRHPSKKSSMDVVAYATDAREAPADGGPRFRSSEASSVGEDEEEKADLAQNRREGAPRLLRGRAQTFTSLDFAEGFNDLNASGIDMDAVIYIKTGSSYNILEDHQHAFIAIDSTYFDIGSLHLAAFVYRRTDMKSNGAYIYRTTQREPTNDVILLKQASGRWAFATNDAASTDIKAQLLGYLEDMPPPIPELMSAQRLSEAMPGTDVAKPHPQQPQGGGEPSSCPSATGSTDRIKDFGLRASIHDMMRSVPPNQTAYDGLPALQELAYLRPPPSPMPEASDEGLQRMLNRMHTDIEDLARRRDPALAATRFGYPSISTGAWQDTLNRSAIARSLPVQQPPEMCGWSTSQGLGQPAPASYRPAGVAAVHAPHLTRYVAASSQPHLLSPELPKTHGSTLHSPIASMTAASQSPQVIQSGYASPAPRTVQSGALAMDAALLRAAAARRRERELRAAAQGAARAWDWRSA